MFPQGRPGFGLLLLRISVAAIFFLVAVQAGFPPTQLVLVGLISASLSVGFLTPVVAILTCVAGVVILLAGSGIGNPVQMFLTLDSAALALLGPGAYSVDARLFGLRVTVVSQRRDVHQ